MKKFNIGFVIAVVLCSLLSFNNVFAQEEILEEEIIQEETIREEAKPEKTEGESIEIIEESLEYEGDRTKSVKELYYKEKYEKTFNYPFEIVWNAVKQSIEGISCQIGYENYKQTDEGWYKGTIKSDYCVFSTGDDTTFATLKKYSLEVPYIRGGIWINGRMQYKFMLTEKEDGSVDLMLKGEISGFEEFVTNEVHFWKSIGIFETRMLKEIEKNCKLLYE